MQLGADKTLREAKAILKRLAEQDQKELSRYDIFRLCRGEFAKVEDTREAIGLLVEHGYLHEITYSAPTGDVHVGRDICLTHCFLIR